MCRKSWSRRPHSCQLWRQIILGSAGTDCCRGILIIYTLQNFTIKPVVNRDMKLCILLCVVESWNKFEIPLDWGKVMHLTDFFCSIGKFHMLWWMFVGCFFLKWHFAILQSLCRVFTVEVGLCSLRVYDSGRTVLVVFPLF